MFKLPGDVVLQFSVHTAIAFLRPRISTIAHIRASCRAYETLLGPPVQKLIADVCVQCHGTSPHVTKCSHGIICRIGASARMAVMRLLDALEDADTRTSAFAQIPKERAGAVDEEVVVRCRQAMSHPDAETKRYASMLMQCWEGEAHRVVSGVVYSPYGGSASLTHQLKPNQQDSDPCLNAVVSLERSLHSKTIPDRSTISSVLELVQQSADTCPLELAGIVSGFVPRSIVVSDAGSKAVNGMYEIKPVTPATQDFKGRHWYKQQNGPHRLFFYTAYLNDPDGWFIDSEEKPSYAFYVSAEGQDEVPLRGWAVYAGSFAAQGEPPAPTLVHRETAADVEFQRSAWRLCKLARSSVRKRSEATHRSQSRSRSRGRASNQGAGRTKGRTAGAGSKGFRGGCAGKGKKGSGRHGSWR